MEQRRRIKPILIPGESVTRFHLVKDTATLHYFEIHVAHHDTGDLDAPAQWYEIYERPDQFVLACIRKELGIDTEDWKILEDTLGSFRYALYEHPLPPSRSRIKIDESAIRGKDWTTVYY